MKSADSARPAGARPSGSRPAARLAQLGLLVCGALLLSACTEEHGDLDAWMTETRAQAPRQVRKVPEPKRFEPFRFEASNDAEPFSVAKLQTALARVEERDHSGIKPDLARRREALEQFPLDAIAMVGALRRASASQVALLQVDKTVYQARVGNYIGQNFGRITQISETEVKVKELVQDAAGDWVERDSALGLQASGGTK